LHQPVYKTLTSADLRNPIMRLQRGKCMVCDIIYCIIRIFPHCKAAISALCVISTMNYEFVAHSRNASCTKANSSNNKSNRKFSPLYAAGQTHNAQYNRIGTVSLKVNHNKLQCIISVGSPTSRIIRERSQSARTSVFSFQKRRPPRLKSSPAQIINKDCGHLSRAG
jgi:hypothetical protein